MRTGRPKARVIRGRDEGARCRVANPSSLARAQTLQFSPQPKACHPKVEQNDQFAQVSQVTRPWGGSRMGGAAFTGTPHHPFTALPCTKLSQIFFFFQNLEGRKKARQKL